MRKDEELESLAKLTELSKYIEYCVVKKFRASSRDAITVSKNMDLRIIYDIYDICICICNVYSVWKPGGGQFTQRQVSLL